MSHPREKGGEGGTAPVQPDPYRPLGHVELPRSRAVRIPRQRLVARFQATRRIQAAGSSYARIRDHLGTARAERLLHDVLCRSQVAGVRVQLKDQLADVCRVELLELDH
jgi:hypothetical protein